ncbi:hypothetical protein V6N11_033778 [Hibiscus sabdariffa]|uniref:Uncharacterized protein n=1 Tax=Hibiscus sabdariffa TaxID=183260 RepID=A0ABR2S0I0_9ROSI
MKTQQRPSLLFFIDFVRRAIEGLNYERGFRVIHEVTYVMSGSSESSCIIPQELISFYATLSSGLSKDDGFVG